MTVDSQIQPGTNLELDIKTLLTTDKACSIQRQEGTPDRKNRQYRTDKACSIYSQEGTPTGRSDTGTKLF